MTDLNLTPDQAAHVMHHAMAIADHKLRDDFVQKFSDILRPLSPHGIQMRDIEYALRLAQQRTRVVFDFG